MRGQMDRLTGFAKLVILPGFQQIPSLGTGAEILQTAAALINDFFL
jgi:hypothetical protein